MTPEKATVLHLLSQRPSLTGSGVTLDALVRHAGAAGWRQAAVVGVPAEDPSPQVASLDESAVYPLMFETPALPFPLPGMSDVMPYRSTRFSAMTPAQLCAYRRAWRDHLTQVVAEVRPQIIHSHHLWIMTSLVKDVAPEIPLVAHCHATGIRQAALCSNLAGEVAGGCAQADRFAVLHAGVAGEVTAMLGVEPDRVQVVGGGFREDLFHGQGRTATTRSPSEVLYVGKLSRAKGLPWLLDAMERLQPRHPELVLHVAGSGAGEEAETLRQRMERMNPLVTLHGALSQAALAALMRRCHVLTLPSFYEGVPLVLAEALASGCRLVSTALPGVLDQLAPHMGDALRLVPLPRLVGVDVPHPEDLPAFVGHLSEALEESLHLPAPEDLASRLAPFTWAAVYLRIEAIWRELLDPAARQSIPRTVI